MISFFVFLNLFRKKTKCLTILTVPFFSFFQSNKKLIMADHLETYGSANLRVLFMDDERGRHTTIQIRVFFGGMTKTFGNLK